MSTNETLSAVALGDAATSIDTAWALTCSFLVLLMQLGFAMLEAGSVRNTSVVATLLKNVVDISVAALVFLAVGYSVAAGEPTTNGLMGVPQFAFSGDGTKLPFFQAALFAGTCVTIVSGALAERTSYIGYLVLAAVVAGVVYPAVAYWFWGGGWLEYGAGNQWSSFDTAGSIPVHVVGGTAALVGAYMVGPRLAYLNVSSGMKMVTLTPQLRALVAETVTEFKRYERTRPRYRSMFNHRDSCTYVWPDLSAADSLMLKRVVRTQIGASTFADLHGWMTLLVNAFAAFSPAALKVRGMVLQTMVPLEDVADGTEVPCQMDVWVVLPRFFGGARNSDDVAELTQMLRSMDSSHSVDDFQIVKARRGCCSRNTDSGRGSGNGRLSDRRRQGQAASQSPCGSCCWPGGRCDRSLGLRASPLDHGVNELHFQGSSMAEVALGVMVLWFTWLGFNGGSVGSITSTEFSATIASRAIQNTMLAPAAGLIGCMIVMRISTGRIADLSGLLNSALGGMVAISAACTDLRPEMAMLTGLVAGVVTYFGGRANPELLRVDDPVSAVAVHMYGGIVGGLSVAFSDREFAAENGHVLRDDQLTVQFVAVGAAVAWTAGITFVVLLLLRVLGLLRVEPRLEALGIDFEFTVTHKARLQASQLIAAAAGAAGANAFVAKATGFGGPSTSGATVSDVLDMADIAAVSAKSGVDHTHSHTPISHTPADAISRVGKSRRNLDPSSGSDIQSGDPHRASSSTYRRRALRRRKTGDAGSIKGDSTGGASSDPTTDDGGRSGDGSQDGGPGSATRRKHGRGKAKRRALGGHNSRERMVSHASDHGDPSAINPSLSILTGSNHSKGSGDRARGGGGASVTFSDQPGPGPARATAEVRSDSAAPRLSGRSAGSGKGIKGLKLHDIISERDDEYESQPAGSGPPSPLRAQSAAADDPRAVSGTSAGAGAGASAASSAGAAGAGSGSSLSHKGSFRVRSDDGLGQTSQRRTEIVAAHGDPRTAKLEPLAVRHKSPVPPAEKPPSSGRSGSRSDQEQAAVLAAAQEQGRYYGVMPGDPTGATGHGTPLSGDDNVSVGGRSIISPSVAMSQAGTAIQLTGAASFRSATARMDPLGMDAMASTRLRLASMLRSQYGQSGSMHRVTQGTSLR